MVLNRYLLNSILPFVLIHFFYNLERIIFITEIVSLVGVYFCFVYLSSCRYRLKKRCVETSLLLLMFYLLVSVLFSLVFYSGTMLKFVRTTTLLYSIFIFYFGYYLYRYYSVYIDRLIFVITPLMVFSVERVSLAIFFFACREKPARLVLLLSFVLISLHVFYTQVSTPVIVLVSFLFLFLYRERMVFVFKYKYVFAAVFAGLSILFILKYQLDGFIGEGYSYFGDSVDNNTYWRLMYWVYLVSSNFNERFLFGVGFGTKLFELTDVNLWWLVVTEHSKGNNLIEYVLGPHNSLIFIFKRTGVVGLVLFMMFIVNLFRRAFAVGDYSIICSLFLINISLLFNVVLESPIWALNYWFVTGLCASYLEKRESKT